MRINGRRGSVRAAFLAVAIGLAWPAVAQTSIGAVSLQGRLSGVSDGARPITVRFYGTASGGTPIETVVVPGVTFRGGAFTAVLPVGVPTFDGSSRWWSVSVDGEAESPRQLVTAVPYAVSAGGVHSPTGSPAIQVDPNATVAIGTAPRGGVRLLVRAAAGEPTAMVIEQNWAFLDSDIPRQLAITGVAGASGADGTPPVLSLGVHSLRNFAAISVQGQPGNSRALALNPIGGGVAVNTTETAGAALNVSGSTRTSTLTITGGSDLAEPFPASPSPAVEPEPGMVLSIDPEHPGALRVATEAYDTKVAGVYSGGNGLPTGMLMGKEGCGLTAQGDDKLPLAMTGRVWVFADESNGAIRPGDRLTSSGKTPGHAMKVTDEAKAPGSVIGKAMTGVDKGTGMVLVLVNLQ